LRIIFMGTPQFATPSLNALLKSQHQVIAVATQPDRPKGRHLNLKPSPVKKVALKHDIPVLQPPNLKNEDFKKTIIKLNPDIVVVVAFGQLIPSWLLSLPKHGCVNIHPSLLPKYRGAAPIQRAIMDGCVETGITIMLMDEGFDTGDILLQKKVPIFSQETAGELHDKLANLSPDLLLKTIQGLDSKTIKPIRQDDAEASFAPKIEKNDAKINWDNSAQEIKNLIRALNPVPGAYSLFENKRLKIFKSEEVREESLSPPGTITEIKKGIGFKVCCGSNSLLILQVQPEAKKIMTAIEFSQGYQIKKGDVLG